jgi:hypothetical protein
MPQKEVAMIAAAEAIWSWEFYSDRLVDACSAVLLDQE